MTWFLFALLTAFFSASEAALSKKFFGDRNPWEMSGVLVLFSLPFFALASLVVERPVLDEGFWTTMAIFVPLNMAGFHMAFRSIKASDLSLTVPFLAFTPVFVIGTGWLILDELPTWWGAAGIAVLVVGSYILCLDPGPRQRWYAPFVAIARNRGSVFMLISAFIFSFCAVLGKLLILQSSIEFAATIFFVIHNAIYVALGVLIGSIKLPCLFARWRVGILIGVVYFCHILCHFFAISLVTAAYMIAIKRLNGLFSVIFDALFFDKGRRLGYRFAGAAIMALGAAVIGILG